MPCRECGFKKETIGHILDECIYTKTKRIEKHDQIKMLIAERLGKRHQVFAEPLVRGVLATARSCPKDK